MTTPTVTTPSAPMKMGPGLLSFGATGGAVDVSSIVTKCATKWKADADDDTVTLSGAVIAGERKYSCQLAFTAYQDDMSTGGLIDFSWSHKGQTVPFMFTPRNGGRSISGDVVVDPVDVGGDTNSKNTSDVTWDCVGEPDLADDL
jgi:hypothetical protein